MCSIILFFSWLILIYQITLTYTITDIGKETDKNKDITDSILSISFLVAVNIFFIESLNFKKSNIDKNSIQKQIIFLFCISVILLLISMYKMNNYKNIDNLRSMRIRNQLYFNYSIFYSIAIFLIYIFYYFVKRK
jgi:Ca2+/H+ antiporter